MRILILALLMLAIASMAWAVGDTNNYRSTTLNPGLGFSFSPFSTRTCDDIGFHFQFGASDSVKFYAYQNQGGSYYTLIDSTTVYADTTGCDQYDKQIIHLATSGANNTVHFDGLLYESVYISLLNLSTVDTASVQLWYLCK